MNFKQEFKDAPIKSVGTLIATILGIISLVAVTSGAFDDYFVSPAELKTQLAATELKITSQYRKEALIIRNSILSDLNAQVKAVEKLFDGAGDGEIALYAIQLGELKKRIHDIRSQ